MTSAWGADGGAVRFEISRFEVQGNTLLPVSVVEAAVRPYAGRERDFGDVQRALEALEQAYRDRGYGLVTIELPEQELHAGVVTLRAVETRVGRLTVKNNVHADQANVLRSLPALQAGRSPNMRAVSSNLRQANESAFKQLTLNLQGSETPGEVDAEVNVKDESPWKLTASVANTGGDTTGKTQVAVALQHANVFGRDHLATLQHITSAEQPDRVQVWGASYRIPLYASGDALELYASHSNVDSGTVNASSFSFAVSGKGSVYGARYQQALALGADVDASLSYGFDIKAFQSSVQLLGVELGHDVTVHPISLGYEVRLPIKAGELGAQVALSRNLPGGSRGDASAFSKARTNATPGYTLLRVSGSATQTLAHDWQLRVMANGQYTPDALVSGEQFGAGGASSVRGFQEREFANDVGLSVNLEAYTPNLCAKAGWSCRGLGFYDAAHLGRNKALPGELSRTTIASAGLGARIAFSTRVTLQTDYGHVLESGGADRAGASRVHVRLSLAY